MKLYNINDNNETWIFSKAIKKGIGKNKGLIFPMKIPYFPFQDIEKILKKDFLVRSTYILSALIGKEISKDTIYQCVQKAFPFPSPVIPIENDIACIELFHGSTLAFKDFGSSFMAHMLKEVTDENISMTILTATSGDTGAAVAHAFYGIQNVRAVILYPKGKISKLQEQLFCTLGKNIYTIAIDSDFDVCQSLVKQSFEDKKLKEKIYLNSANSINISRIFAQICYYFEAIAQIPKKIRKNLVISIPSGNFGNLTAGLIAKSIGLQVKRFIVATNANDTVPRFLSNGKWKPYATIATLSNAMDVSKPNNWPRVEELFRRNSWQLKKLYYETVSDQYTINTMKKMKKLGYICEPHSAVSYYALRNKLKDGEFGLFLGTAQPAKFQENVENIIRKKLIVPKLLSIRSELPLLSHNLRADFSELRKFLIQLPNYE